MGALLLDRRVLPKRGALTLSAGVITDVTRLAGVEGDGEAYPDSSVGVWPAYTQYIKNSQAVTNTTGWAVNGTGADTPARSTAQAKFGSTSLLIGGTGVASTQGATYSGTDAGSAAVGETWTAVVWAYVVSGTVELGIYLSERDAGGGDLVTSASGGTNVSQGWTKLTYTYTLVNASVSKIYPKIVTISNPGAAWQAYIQVNLFKSFIALPYSVADGGTSSRGPGRIQGPASVLDETQMLIAARVKIGAVPTGSNRLWSWGDDANERLELTLAATNGRPVMIRQTGGAGNSATPAAGSVAVGDYVSYIGGVDAANVYAAMNGAALTSAANSSIPTLAATEFDIGRQAYGADGWLAQNALWVAICRAAPTDELSDFFDNFGNNRPLPHQIRPSVDVRFLAHFNGDGTQYRWSAA